MATVNGSNTQPAIMSNAPLRIYARCWTAIESEDHAAHACCCLLMALSQRELE
jgi:hypothetical protein